jgi:integrase
MRRVIIPFMARPRGTGSKRLRGKTWWVRYSHHGKLIEESTESPDERDADKLLRRRLGEMESAGRPSRNQKTTVADLLALVFADYDQRKLRSSKMTRQRAEAHITPELGHIPAATFTTATAKKYISFRRSESASDATINRELSILRRAFTLAAQEDPPLITRPPHIPKLAEDNAREGFVDHEEYPKLLAELPPRLKCLLVVAYHLGLRLGELRKLTWAQVDLAGGVIKLPGRSTKSKKPRSAPIYGDMRPYLDMQKSERDAKWPDCPWVFHYRNKPIGQHVDGWREACEAAGVPDLLRHDLRRSAVRNMERAGLPRTIAMSITGHKTESIYRRYDIVSEKDLTLARDRMEAFLGTHHGQIMDKEPKQEKAN